MKYEVIDNDAVAPKPLGARVATDLLHERQEELLTWIMENAPRCLSDQHHLDEGTVERVYWHYGYLMALRDMLALFGNASTPRH